MAKVKANDLNIGDLLEVYPGGPVITILGIQRPDTGKLKNQTVVKGPLAWIRTYPNDHFVEIKIKEPPAPSQELLPL